MYRDNNECDGALYIWYVGVVFVGMSDTLLGHQWDIVSKCVSLLVGLKKHGSHAYAFSFAVAEAQ